VTVEIIIIGAVVVLFLGWLFSGSGSYRINHELKQADDQDVHGEQTGADFDSYGALKKAVAQLLTNYQCPRCGNHKVTGSGVIVRYGKVRLQRQEAYKGWFGGTKYKDVHYKTVWRVHEIGLRNAPGRALLNLFGAFDDPPGKLECQSKGCGWTESGERGGTLSLGDLLSGKFS
jgi:hypothetical protein